MRRVFYIYDFFGIFGITCEVVVIFLLRMFIRGYIIRKLGRWDSGLGFGDFKDSIFLIEGLEGVFSMGMCFKIVLFS